MGWVIRTRALTTVVKPNKNHLKVLHLPPREEKLIQLFPNIHSKTNTQKQTAIFSTTLLPLRALCGLTADERNAQQTASSASGPVREVEVIIALIRRTEATVTALPVHTEQTCTQP